MEIISNQCRISSGETVAAHNYPMIGQRSGSGGIVEFAGVGGGDDDIALVNHHILVDRCDVVLTGHILRTTHHHVGVHLIAVDTRIGGIGLAHGGGQHIPVVEGDTGA